MEVKKSSSWLVWMHTKRRWNIYSTCIYSPNHQLFVSFFYWRYQISMTCIIIMPALEPPSPWAVDQSVDHKNDSVGFLFLILYSFCFCFFFPWHYYTLLQPNTTTHITLYVGLLFMGIHRTWKFIHNINWISAARNRLYYIHSYMRVQLLHISFHFERIHTKYT